MLIGAGDYGQFVNARQFTNGLIDEVEIFNRSLSQSEIQNIVNAGSGGKCKGYFDVTNTNDSGQGSLRQAIIDANNRLGLQTISFDIPGLDVHTITPLTALPEITETVYIDGYTQPGSTQNTLSTGDNAVLLIELNGTNLANANGLTINPTAPNSTVRGLVINRCPNTALEIQSGSNTIEGNFIGTDPTGTINLGNGNGVRMVSAGGNLIGGETEFDRGVRNIISGNRFYGVLTVSNSSGNRIWSNYIGTNAMGTAALPNGIGVSVDGTQNEIGGASFIGKPAGGTGAPAGSSGGIAGNVISGNGVAVRIENGSRTRILYNLIGTQADGTTALGNTEGSVIVNGINNFIDSNIIAFNGGAGVAIESGNKNSTRSSIFSNSGLGIDLSPAGITPNDDGDGDIGPNDLQNFPVLTDAITSGNSTTLRGTFNGRPNAPYRIDFYANASCHSSGNGEGQELVAVRFNLMTDSNGNASFLTNAQLVPLGQFVTATATDSAGNTSEFSACRQATAPLANITLDPTTVEGGQTSSARVSLADFAQTGGAIIALASGDAAVATVPTSVTVPEGSLSANFNVATSAVTSDTTVDIAATYGGLTRSATLTVKRPTPDLQVTSLEPPAQAQTDSSFDLSWTDANMGQARADGPWVDQVYLSPDNQLGNDTLLAEFAFTQSLEPSESANRIQSISIPRAAVPQDGSYYLIVRTDAAGNVPEVYETNNSRLAPITVSRALIPDLTVEFIETPDTAFFDQTVTVRWTVKNIGNASTNASEWVDELFLSNDRIPSGDDAIQLEVLNISYLNAGERYIASADVRIARGLSNTHYFIVKSDVRGHVVEYDENNNTLDKPINIQVPPLPDLQVPLVQGPEEGFTGQPMQLNWRVENRGTGNTLLGQVPWVDGIYLSQDQTLNPQTDRFIGTGGHSGGLAQNDGYTVSNFSVNIPNDIAGDWYVFVVADSQNSVYEFTGESNNSNLDGRHPIHIHATPPDLIVASASASANGTANQQITANWTVQNQGAFDANPNWIDTIYLSADATLEPTTDKALASVPRTSTLGPGLSYNASAVVRLPACISGVYFIFVFTDSGNQVFEYDPNINAETNNFSAAQAIQIANAPPDLRVTELSNAAAASAGQPVLLGWTVSNPGTGPTIEGSWIDRVYLSRSATLDGTALLAGSFTHTGDLTAGTAYARSENVTVPTSAQGTYNVFVVTDAGQTVAECGGDNNNVGVSSTPLDISNNLPDLTVTNVNTPFSAFAGQSVAIQWVVSNTGTAIAPSSALKDGVYFSTDPVLDTSDELLATALTNGQLAVGSTYNVNAQATIPPVTAGTYYLIVKADSDNFIFEGLHEDNNISSQAIVINVPEVDLQTTAVSAPDHAFSGQAMIVSWVVTNAGTQPTFASQWTDRILLSRDQILDATDPVIGFKVQEGALSADGSYNATVNAEIPPGLTGSYYVFVLSDVHHQAAEANEDNNTGVSNAVTLRASAAR